MESWLCEVCYRSPLRLTEQRAVESSATGDYRAMRRTLREQFSWFGGWEGKR
jgi:hypothetical protein